MTILILAGLHATLLRCNLHPSLLRSKQGMCLGITATSQLTASAFQALDNTHKT